MPGFDIAKSILPSSLFIEASAGTGKTYAIITALIRFLCEENLSLDQILVVTFTRAAVFELKTRLRTELEQAINDQKRNDKQIKTIRNALFSFDEANIYTIHSFSHRMLQEFALLADVSFDLDFERSFKNEMGSILKDLLCKIELPSLLLPFQFEKLIQECDKDFEILIQKILHILAFRYPIASSDPIHELEKECSLLIPHKGRLNELLKRTALFFRGFTNRKRELKTESAKAIDVFCELLESTPFSKSKINACLEYGEILCSFSSENCLKKEEFDPLFFHFQNRVLPLIQKAIDPLETLLYLANLLKEPFDRGIQEEELFFFEDFLQINAQMVKKHGESIRKKYRAVLIDEFQDTDPLQWEIFSTLFCNPSYTGKFLVVGDPKQAIYAFRGADIYTYLEARKAFNQEHIFPLEVNYRSSPQLVSALNTLLCSTPDFFPLPKLKSFLSCPKVYASSRVEDLQLNDAREAIHFFLNVEKEKWEEALFTFIVEEASALAENKCVALHEMAVLVKDRYQAERFYSFCRRYNLPASLRRTESLVFSPALDLLMDFLHAVLNPNDFSSLLQILGGPLFQLSENEIKQILESEKEQQKNVKRFYIWKEILEKEGILVLFYHLTKEQTFLDEELYFDLLQLVELGAKKISFFEEYIPFYESVKKDDPEKEEYKKRQKQIGDSLQILTIHMSKGLEFGIVFALGLAASFSTQRGMILSEGKVTISNQVKEDLEAEKMRLFYVAVTRAKKRLYLPAITYPENSIMHLFFNKSGGIEKWKQIEAGISFSYCPKQVITKFTLSQEKEVYERERYRIAPITAQFIQSFTSLAKPELRNFEGKSPENDLPLGVKSGIILHEILEKIDLAKALNVFSPYEMSPLVHPFLKHTEFASYANIISKVIFNAFHTPLQNFCLKDVNPEKFFREMEFLYLDEKVGAIKGVIDLFFEYRGKYYLIDWKSNYLGPKTEDYAIDHLKKEMKSCDYHLQAKIYRTALQKYLSIFDSRPFAEIYGGIFYLFLRGLPDYGVWCDGSC